MTLEPPQPTDRIPEDYNKAIQDFDMAFRNLLIATANFDMMKTAYDKAVVERAVAINRFADAKITLHNVTDKLAKFNV